MFMLVIGGAASGKSAFAEACSAARGAPALYVATMEPFGEEAAARIERHRAQRRGAGFVTFECPCDVSSDGVAYDEETRAWQRALGRINARLAGDADCVVEVVCGIPVWVKGDEDIWKGACS